MRQALLCSEQLTAIGSGVAGKIGQTSLYAVNAGLDHAGRMSDAFRLAVDHSDDLADFTNGVADRSEARLSSATALNTGFDLRRYGARLPRQFADRRRNLARRCTRVVGKLFYLGRNDREAAASV